MSTTMSEKNLLKIPQEKKGRRRHFSLSHNRLELYAFWTGLLSTVISLLETIVIALKR